MALKEGKHLVLLKAKVHQLNIRAGPSADYDIKFQVEEGNILWAQEDRCKKWIDVILVQGKEKNKYNNGWVHSDYVVGFNEKFDISTLKNTCERFPDNFRGIKWGASIKNVTDLKLVKTHKFKKTYKRKAENLIFQNVTPTGVFYEFYKGRLMKAYMQFNKQNWEHLKSVLKHLYPSLSCMKPYHSDLGGKVFSLYKCDVESPLLKISFTQVISGNCIEDGIKSSNS